MKICMLLDLLNFSQHKESPFSKTQFGYCFDKALLHITKTLIHTEIPCHSDMTMSQAWSELYRAQSLDGTSSFSRPFKQNAGWALKGGSTAQKIVTRDKNYEHIAIESRLSKRCNQATWVLKDWMPRIHSFWSTSNESLSVMTTSSPLRATAKLQQVSVNFIEVCKNGLYGMSC